MAELVDLPALRDTNTFDIYYSGPQNVELKTVHNESIQTNSGTGPLSSPDDTYDEDYPIYAHFSWGANSDGYSIAFRRKTPTFSGLWAYAIISDKAGSYSIKVNGTTPPKQQPSYLEQLYKMDTAQDIQYIPTEKKFFLN